MDRFVPRDDQGGIDDALACHCEAHSAVAIHVFVRPPMDRFVPRDDQGGVMTPWPVIARRTAPWQSMSLSYRRRIASCLAMTGQRRDGEEGRLPNRSFKRLTTGSTVFAPKMRSA
jgi:choline dehydrogenase-like flavoprotein